MKEREIFISALEITSKREREEFVANACSGDAALHKRVEELLVEHEKKESFVLDAPNPALMVTLPQHAIQEEPGMMIGRYKLLEQIGEGGFGVVFMAEQEEPVRRKVALKIIKPGMDTAEVIARFEAERQALAIMDHPNIARVLDAGSTETCRPYFVMELVRGIAITDYCDRNNLTTQERLELFESVCRAVQHAHQKGIIHRDIKPSNVMVTMRDDVAVPKVIDFGVAKATNQRLTERTLFTRYAQMLGTPLYMSPEQAQMNELDVDTRSDIYSLGVLLYELLTGTTPLDHDRLRAAAYDELLKIIREEEPPRPSTRISTLGDAVLKACADRQTDPKHLHEQLRGELDWIVMKSLEKDRTRRYESANDLAIDIRRYLADETVAACPPSVVYRFQKFARRNKKLIGSLSVIGIVLIAASLFSTWQAIRAVRAERVAQRNLQNANLARQQANAERQRAEIAAQAAVQAREREFEERKRADDNFRAARHAVDQYFTIVSQNSLLDQPQHVALRAQLLNAALEYYQEFARQRADDPQLSSELVAAYFRIAQISNELGIDDWLIPVEKGIKIAESLVAKADVSRFPSWQSGMFHIRVTTGLRHKNPNRVVDTFQNAVEIWEALVAKYPHVPGFRRDLASMVFVLANAQGKSNVITAMRTGQRALELAEELVRDFPDVPTYRFQLAFILHHKALALKALRQFKRADEPNQRAIDILELLVSDFPNLTTHDVYLAEALHARGPILASTGRLDAAADAFQDAAKAWERLIKKFPGVIQYRDRLDFCYSDLGQLLAKKSQHPLAAAEAYRNSAAVLERLVAYFPGQPKYRLRLFHRYRLYGFRLWDADQPDRVLDAFSESDSVIRQLVTEYPNEPEYGKWYAAHNNDRAKLLIEVGMISQADAMLDEALEIGQKLVADHPNIDDFRKVREQSYSMLGELLIGMYKAATEDSVNRDEVVKRIQDLVIHYRRLIEEEPQNPNFYNEAAWVVANTEGDINEAIQFSRKSIELARATNESPQILGKFMDTLAHCMFANGDYAAAIEYQEEAVRLDPETESHEHALEKFRTALKNEIDATK